MNDTSRGPWIQFQSGAIWYPFSPRAEDLDVRDLEALSRICRFNGHSPFYSVAEHSYRCASRARELGYSRELQWQSLNHDSHEATTGDFAAPLKFGGPHGANDIGRALRELESRQSDAIREALKMPLKLAPEVKRIDLEMLATERRDLMVASGVDWGDLPDALPDVIHPRTPEDAWSSFVSWWNYLKPEGVARLLR